MIGKRVEKLVIVKRLPESMMLCQCDCGNTRIVYAGHFNTGKIKSCGCHFLHGVKVDWLKADGIRRRKDVVLSL